MPFAHEPSGRLVDGRLLSDKHEMDQLEIYFKMHVSSHKGTQRNAIDTLRSALSANTLTGQWKDYTSIYHCDGIDGSYYESSIHTPGHGLPQDELACLVNIGHRRIDLDSLSRAGQHAIIDPGEVTRSIVSIGKLDFWFAGGGLKSGTFPTSEDGWRWDLANALRKPAARLPPQPNDDIEFIGKGMSLLDVIYLLRRDGGLNFPSQCYNESCGAPLDPGLFLAQRTMNSASVCPGCGSVQNELETTGIPKFFMPFGSNEALWNRLMLLLERVRALQILLAQTPLQKVGVATLSDIDGTVHGIGGGQSRTHVLVDGPLNLYGMGRNLVMASRKVIDAYLMHGNDERPMLVGNIKSGVEKNFLDTVSRYWTAQEYGLPKRGWAVVFPWLLDDLVQKGSGWRGVSNDIGHNMFFISQRGQPFIISVALPQPDPKDVDGILDKNAEAKSWINAHHAQFSACDGATMAAARRWIATKLLAGITGTPQWRICQRAGALVEAAEIVLYPSGTSPQAEAHKHSSISKQSGERLMGFIRQAWKRKGGYQN